jgi:hypothetical protein
MSDNKFWLRVQRTAADRKTLRRVAEVLKREADCLRTSYCPGPEHDKWRDSRIEQMMRTEHDEMLALAKLLRSMAARP